MKKLANHSEKSSRDIIFNHSYWSVVMGFMFALSACGGDSSSSGPSDIITSESDIIEATFDELPVCTGKREGVTAYVKDEKTAYTCIDGDWIPDGDDSAFSSSSVTQSDDSREGLSSSVGKVKSSSSRHCEDCKDDAISSSCTDKVYSSSSGKSEKEKSSSSEASSSISSANEQNSSTSEQPDIVVIKDKSVTGVSQKGPFVIGSTVKLYELDGKTYAQTGKILTGKITTDDGKFSVSSVTLASQYALLEANGYFRNEITGNKSKGPVTLNALTDLSDRKTVNLNLLTHLEYERALYLVGAGEDVSSAKKQAEAEILNAFGIKGDFASSEDLDIFSKGDGNAALLAFSVLMLRDLSEADLTELLTKFATDIEKDGSWDDAFTKAKIADWAQSKDLAGILSSIRSNIEKWNLGTVPEFEKFVRNFWYANYGLGDCDKAREGEVIATKNEFSITYGTKIRYICKDGVWLEATDVEKDFYMSGKDIVDDGKLWMGLVTGKMYKYDERNREWMIADAVDSILNNACTAKREGATDKDEKENLYYCSALGWLYVTSYWSWDVPKEARLNPEIIYGSMTDSRDGKKYKTVIIGDQTWMAENLNYADSAKTPSLKGKSWCYGNEAKNCDVAGRLYTWTAAIDSVKWATDADNPKECGSGMTCTLPAKVQGICPDGWHLPNYDEWNSLFTAVGGQSTAGTVLKVQTGWDDNGNGTDAYGFSALPGGSLSFFNGGSYASFWSSTEYSSEYHVYAYRMSLNSSIEKANLSNKRKEDGGSVRCIQD